MFIGANLHAAQPAYLLNQMVIEGLQVPRPCILQILEGRLTL